MSRFIYLILLLASSSLNAQVGIGTTTPDASSMLDLTSTNKGILIPRLTTTQKNAIATPAKGLMVFDVTTNSFWFYNSASWIEFAASSGSSNLWTVSSNNIYNSNTGNIGIGTSIPAQKLDVYGNIALNGKTAITDLSDNWLRLNQNGHYTNGIYSPGFLRIDGGITSGAASSLGGGTILATSQIQAPIFYDYNNTGYYVDPASTSNVNVLRFNTADCLNGTCPPNGAIRMTPNLHLNSGSGYAVILNWDNGTTGANQTFRIGNGQGSDVFYVYADGQCYTTNWFRSIGNTGLYFQTYGGGLYMTDPTWIRTYNDKPFLASGGLAGYGNSSFGTQFGGSPRIYANYDNATGGGLAVSDDGGFYDFNDGYVSYRGSNGLIIRSDNNASGSNLALFSMQNPDGSLVDKTVTTGTNAWGFLGKSGQAWWQSWAFSFNNASERSLKKDITTVEGGIRSQVMADLDKMHPYLYRYKDEMDELRPGMEAKYRPGLHLGLIVDDSPDYIQSQSYTGVDIYAAATLAIAAAKDNRDEIKKIKAALNQKTTSTTIQDFGSQRTTGKELFVTFDPEFVNSLKGTIPVITVSTSVKGADLTVQDKSSTGFRIIVNGNVSDVPFDYVAIAKVKNVNNNVIESAPPALMNARMYVDEGTKARVRQYWKSELENQKRIEIQKGVEAAQLQQVRKKEIESSMKNNASNNKALQPVQK